MESAAQWLVRAVFQANFVFCAKSRQTPSKHSDPVVPGLTGQKSLCVCLETQEISGPKKPWQPQIWQDLTRFSPLDFLLLSPDFGGARLTKLHREPGEKAKNPVESLQWRRRPEIAHFCPLSWSNVSWKYKLFPLANRRVVPGLSRLSESSCVQNLCAFFLP